MSFQQDSIQQADSLALKAEGINLGPLLEPDPVPFRFDTIGWPILAAVLLIATLLISLWQIRKYKRNRYRREALLELRQISSGQKDLAHIFVVLKHAAIIAFSREEVGNLSGKTWLLFLEKTGKNIAFIDHEVAIENLIYKDLSPEADVREKLLSNAEKWIRTHAS